MNESCITLFPFKFIKEYLFVLMIDPIQIEYLGVVIDNCDFYTAAGMTSQKVGEGVVISVFGFSVKVVLGHGIWD